MKSPEIQDDQGQKSQGPQEDKLQVEIKCPHRCVLSAAFNPLQHASIRLVKFLILLNTGISS